MDLLQPIFVNQSGETYEAGLGPDNSSYSLKDINNRIQTDIDSGLEDFLLFITPNKKTWTPDWKFQAEVVNKIKTKFPKIQLSVDVCLCSTLPDGHCCVLDKPDTSEQLLVNLGKQLESAGADVLAPSDMGENTVKNLKAETSKLIMAYVKWRSVFYSTFRDVSDSKPSSERTYQLNVKNEWGMTSRSHQYVADGADALLLKPASHSMDIFGLVKAGTYKQVGLFQVSDEYVGLPTIAHQLEIATIYKRAGASFLVTYGARNLVKKLV